MTNNPYIRYADPPYPRRLPTPRQMVDRPVTASTHNALVLEYNELLEDIDMLLRAIDAMRDVGE